MNLTSLENRYGDDKVYDACGLIGIMDVSGERFSGRDIVTGITQMEERGNGLGAGFAVYGCYPEHADCYAFHVMFTEPDSRSQVEEFLKENFILAHAERVPFQSMSELHDPPAIWRYFLRVDVERIPEELKGDEQEYVVDRVMALNTSGIGIDVMVNKTSFHIHLGHCVKQIGAVQFVDEFTGDKSDIGIKKGLALHFEIKDSQGIFLRIFLCERVVKPQRKKQE